MKLIWNDGIIFDQEGPVCDQRISLFGKFTHIN